MATIITHVTFFILQILLSRRDFEARQLSQLLIFFIPAHERKQVCYDA